MPNLPIEPLEPRRMLAANIAFAGGVLRVVAERALANTIVVQNSGDGLSLSVLILSVDRRGVARTVSDTIPRSRGITRVDIIGGNRDDTITIDQAEGPVTLPTRIDARNGHDTVTGGDGADLIVGGPGNDTIDAGEGANVVRGLSGNDAITAAGGADRIDAGPGHDTVNAGDGGDLVVAGVGNDVVSGGRGDDLVFGGPGNDILAGDDDNDTLWGGPGNDEVSGGFGNDRLGGRIGRNVLNGGPGTDEFIARATSGFTGDFDEDQDVLNTITRDDGNRPPVV